MSSFTALRRRLVPRTRKGRLVLGAGLTATTLLGGAGVTMWPASAAATNKISNTGDWMTATQFEFVTPRMSQGSGSKVRGTAHFFVNDQGQYWMTGDAHNTNIAWRNVTFKCDLNWGMTRSIHLETARKRVDGRNNDSTINVDVPARYDSDIVADWQAIRMQGSVDCDMELG
jgi:hypothetical protein